MESGDARERARGSAYLGEGQGCLFQLYVSLCATEIIGKIESCNFNKHFDAYIYNKYNIKQYLKRIMKKKLLTNFKRSCLFGIVTIFIREGIATKFIQSNLKLKKCFQIYLKYNKISICHLINKYV